MARTGLVLVAALSFGGCFDNPFAPPADATIPDANAPFDASVLADLACPRCPDNRQSCVLGECVCPAGLVTCATGCVPNDARNCRFCGVTCPPGATCDGEKCVCPLGLELCPPGSPTPACVDLRYDASNCGSCGNVCRYCAGGVCCDDGHQDNLSCAPPAMVTCRNPSTGSTFCFCGSVPTNDCRCGCPVGTKCIGNNQCG